MDFDKVILAHSRWKIQLREFIAGNVTVDVNTVGRDDQCEFGKWLLNEGRTYADLPNFARLKEKHATFHKVVAQVVTQAKSLPKEKALALLDPVGTDYGRASSECINSISELRKSIS